MFECCEVLLNNEFDSKLFTAKPEITYYEGPEESFFTAVPQLYRADSSLSKTDPYAICRYIGPESDRRLTFVLQRSSSSGEFVIVRLR